MGEEYIYIFFYLYSFLYIFSCVKCLNIYTTITTTYKEAPTERGLRGSKKVVK